MSTAREKIVRSPTANKVLDRYISPVYENSEIGCTDIEVRGREIDRLEALIEDVYNQFIIHKATWALPMWCYEYGVEINEGMTYEEVRSLVKQHRFLVLPPNEYNIKQYASIASGTDVEIIQNTGPHTFDILLLRDSDNPNQYSWSKVYRAVKRIRPAHLSFNLIPAVSRDIGIEVNQYIIKFHNPMTGQKGLRAGTKPTLNNIGQILRSGISVESAGQKYDIHLPKTGTKPGISKYAELYYADTVVESERQGTLFINDEEGTPHGIYNLGIVEVDGVGVDVSSGIYDMDLMESGIRPIDETGNALGNVSTETETETYGIMSDYCGLSDLGDDF